MKTRAVSLILCLLSACGQGLPFPEELVDFIAAPPEPVFTPQGPGHWDEAMRERAWIMREGDTYHMWYDGFREGQGNARPALGYATSQDGRTWQRFSDEPIYSESWIEDVFVIKDNGTYYMFSEGEGDRAHLLTSQDRIHWVDRGNLDIRHTDGTPLLPHRIGTVTVWKEKGLWYLIYERLDLGVWLATSSDLNTFTNVDDMPVITLGPSDLDSLLVAVNQVIKYKGLYYAYYNCQGGSLDWSLCVAASADLMHWEKYPQPLFPPADSKISGFVVDDGKQFVFYTTHGVVLRHVPRHPSDSFTGDELR